MAPFPNLTIVDWRDNKIVLLDQTALPNEEKYVSIATPQELAHAIKTMIVRGAPAIGVAAAMGVALAVATSKAKNTAALSHEVKETCQILFQTRPTAVNLAWGLQRMQDVFEENKNLTLTELKTIMIEAAKKIKDDDIACNRQMGENGHSLLNDGDTVLTHCNAGALCSAGFGTALGVIYAACAHGKKIAVIADETRPVLQGARLTAWELKRHGVPVTVIADNMAASLMKRGRIQKVMVGADRIAANGDVANKIGTYSVAVNAHHHGIPFYVAAPLSTIDVTTKTGDDIPIEERHDEEITHWRGHRQTPEGVAVFNPAFDVTPVGLVTAIITEKGVVAVPNAEKIEKLLAE